MPTEPERDIEKTLRAYAKKRQEQHGAPAELHPATRRSLQGEVARLRGGKTPEKPSFWAQLFGPSWPRAIASVAALVVMAAVAAALMLPALSKSKRASTFGVAQYGLQDAQALRDYRKLALNSPQSPSDLPARPGVREESAHMVAGETQRYSAGTPPALASPLEQKEQSLDKKIQLAAKTAPSTRDRITMKDETVDTDLAKQALSVPTQGAPPAPGAADVPESASSPATATISNSRLALELEESHSSRAPAPAPAAPPVVATTPAALPSSTFSFKSAAKNHSLSDAPAGGFPTSASFAGKPSELVTDSLSSPAVTTESGRRSEAASASLGTNVTNAWTQRFARVNSTNNLSRRQRTISRAVLRSFRVEQNGNQIRFIDGDGSVYSGFLGDSENEKDVAETSTVAPGAAAVGHKYRMIVTNSANLDGANQTIQNLYFRVSGTNRSLRQPVVFTGNFAPVTAIGRSQKLYFDNGVAGSGSVAPNLGPLNWQLLNSQLQGKVLVGGSNQMDIKALPVNH